MNWLLEWVKRVGGAPWLPPFGFAWAARGMLEEPSGLTAFAVPFWAFLWWMDVRDRRWDWQWEGDRGVLKVKGPLTQQQVDELQRAWADLNERRTR